jgi:hypothetical protein
MELIGAAGYSWMMLSPYDFDLTLSLRRGRLADPAGAR